MVQSFIIYSSLFVVISFFGTMYYRAKKYHKGNGQSEVCFWFPILFFAVIIGLRYDVGTDHVGYIHDYLYGTNQQFEIGFAWLMDTCKSYHLHFAYFFGILAFIQIFCYYTSFKRQSFLLPYLGLMLFVSNEWFFWVNGIRQATAMCIWLLSLECFNRRKYVWMVVFMALAITFHKSAVILVVLYPLLFLRKDYFSNIKVQMIIFISVFVVRMSLESVFLKIEPLISFYAMKIGYDSYLNRDLFSDSISGGSGIFDIWKNLINLSIILCSTKMKMYFNDKKFITIYTLFIIALITKNIFPDNIVVLSRPFRYFYIFIPIMWAYFAYYLKTSCYNKYNKLLYYIMLSSIILAFYISITLWTKNSHLLYQFYFDVFK